MSKKIECRLPDQLYADLKSKCQDEKITVTDAVISNITGWLYDNNDGCHDKSECGKTRGFDKKQECHDKPDIKIVDSGASIAAISQAIIKDKADIPIIRRKAPTISHHPSCTCAVCKAHKSAHLTA